MLHFTLRVDTDNINVDEGKKKDIFDIRNKKEEEEKVKSNCVTRRGAQNFSHTKINTQDVIVDLFFVLPLLYRGINKTKVVLQIDVYNSFMYNSLPYVILIYNF